MTSTQQRVAELRLRMKTEKQSISDAKNQVASLQRQFKDFATETERTNLKLEQQVRVFQAQQIAAQTSNAEIAKFATEERRVQLEVDRTTASVDKQTQSLRAQYQAAKQAAQAPLPDTLSFGGGGGVLAAFGREARLAVPAIGIPGTGIGTESLFRVTEILGKVGLSLKSLALAGPPVVLAIGAIVAIMSQWSAAFEKTKQAILDQIDLQSRLELLRKTGSASDVQTQIQENEQKRDEALSKIENANAVINSELAALSEVQAEGIRRALAEGKTGFSDPVLAAAAKTIQEQVPIAEKATITLGFLRDILKDDAFQARDAAQAHELLADKMRGQRIQLLSQISQLTTEEIDKRVQAARDAQAAIQGTLDAGKGTPEFLAGLRQQFYLLGAEISTLSYEIRPVVELREKEAAAAKKLLGIITGIPDAVKAVVDVYKRLQDASRKLTEIGAANKEKLDRIEQDRTDRLTEAELDRSNAVIEARRDADIAESEAARKAGLDRVEIERKSQINIAKILRRAKTDISRAIQDRDAVALDAARQRKKEELADEKTASEERLKELDDNLQEQVRTIRLRLGEQLRTIDIRYKDQLRLANKAAQKAIELEQARYKKEYDDAVRAYQEILRVEQAKNQVAISGAGQFLSTTANMFTALINQARTAQAAVTQKAATTTPYRPTPTNPNPINLPGIRVPTLASGGYVQQSGLAYLHAGERVVNPNRGQGGINISVNLNGMTKRRVLREIERQLDVYTEDVFA